MFVTAPASAAAGPAAMRLSGQLVQVADQHGSGFAAIRLAKGVLLPVEAQSVKDVASGSAVIVDVVIPTKVQNAAVANRTLTTQCVDGKDIALPLRSSDLAAASHAERMLLCRAGVSRTVLRSPAEWVMHTDQVR